MTTPLEQARIEQALAEARKFDAEALHFTEQAREKAFHAKSAEFHADNARMANAEARRREEVQLAQNHLHSEYWFNDGFDETSTIECAAQLAIWHRADPNCDMAVKINSPGGEVFAGMHLFDDVMALSQRPWDDREDYPTGGHKTTVIGRGMTASMAGIFMQAFDHRILGPECWFLVHEISTFVGGKIGEIRDDVKFWDKVAGRVADIFVRRSNGKITKATFMRKWDKKDWWLSSNEALQYGFVDAIG